MNFVFVGSEGGHWRLRVASVPADEGSDLVHPTPPSQFQGSPGSGRNAALETKTLLLLHQTQLIY